MRTILLLGASGLIGRFVTDDLRARGFRVIGVARSLSRAQKMSPLDLELPLLAMDVTGWMHLISAHAVDVIVNCVGVLQDGPGCNTMAVHRDFVARLLRAISASDRAIRLVQISIPGIAGEDQTAFATTKREAEGLIAASSVHYAILRPGFVVAPSAYGGSAMLRALAAMPFDLPAGDMARRFQPVAVEDVAATVAWLAAHDPEDRSIGGVSWDLMQKEPMTMAEVIGQWRRAYGSDGRLHVAMPEFGIEIAAGCGDLAGRLGWKSPMRSTAIAELRRGVQGDPLPWIAATGIEPKTLTAMIGQHPATIQDKWFARLFLVKALIIVTLVLFWIVSGFVALFVSYSAAAEILGSHGMPPALVDPIAIGTSVIDIIIGGLIAVRRTSAIGLVAGILVLLGYIVSAAILAPELWIEPLGSLVKIGPAIVLMLVAFLMRDNR
ncbi:MAG: SDR family oxidoreductase [Alphaproteobacteria bacterium]|nr:SDR family oxidoreductase [Alphaproteobacteria bacterium]